MDEIKKTPAGDGNLVTFSTGFLVVVDEIKKTPAGDGNVHFIHNFLPPFMMK